jgi:hypothetical protein
MCSLTQSWLLFDKLTQQRINVVVAGGGGGGGGGVKVAHGVFLYWLAVGG